MGEGARKFAETHGLGGEDPLTEDIKQEWREWKAKQVRGKKPFSCQNTLYMLTVRRPEHLVPKSGGGHGAWSDASAVL